ncbi:MAG: serine protein kinase RIO [Promethearchaeota archaeon]
MWDKKIDDVMREMIDRRKEKKKDRSKDRAAVSSVLDKRTVMTLQSLLNNGILSEIVGIISAGKEANVYLGQHPEEGEVGIKIYKVDSQTSKWMQDYLKGDYRFKKIGRNTSKLIFTWTMKEFRNLKRAYRGGIPVPKPIFSKNNILVMEFIGEGGTPAPKLKDVDELEDPEALMAESLAILKSLYNDCDLVHGDFSEYNILYKDGKIHPIDMGQSVTTSHPRAGPFLVRDIRNILNYFTKWGVDVPDLETTYYQIVGKENEED